MSIYSSHHLTFSANWPPHPKNPCCKILTQPCCNRCTPNHCKPNPPTTPTPKVTPPPDRNCQWSGWRQWSSCSKTCGSGTMTRSRHIQVEFSGNGKKCVYSDNIQKRNCIVSQTCPPPPGMITIIVNQLFIFTIFIC